MPNYTFRCKVYWCSYEEDFYHTYDEDTFSIQHKCPNPTLHPDTREMERVITVPAVRSPFREHFSQSTGTFVSSDQNFRDTLKAQSESATLRTGVEHSFVPTDSHEQLGINKDRVAQLDTTHDSNIKAGKREVKKWH